MRRRSVSAMSTDASRLTVNVSTRWRSSAVDPPSMPLIKPLSIDTSARTTAGVAHRTQTPTTKTPAMEGAFVHPSITYVSLTRLSIAQPHNGNVTPNRATDHIVTTTVKLAIPTGSMSNPYPTPFQPGWSARNTRIVAQTPCGFSRAAGGGTSNPRSTFARARSTMPMRRPANTVAARITRPTRATTTRPTPTDRPTMRMVNQAMPNGRSSSRYREPAQVRASVRGARRRFISAVPDVDGGQCSLQAAGQPPIPSAEELHRRRHHHQANDGGVDEDCGSQAEPDQLDGTQIGNHETGEHAHHDRSRSSDHSRCGRKTVEDRGVVVARFVVALLD